jgi:hypothetical protein
MNVGKELSWLYFWYWNYACIILLASFNALQWMDASKHIISRFNRIVASLNYYVYSNGSRVIRLSVFVYFESFFKLKK